MWILSIGERPQTNSHLRPTFNGRTRVCFFYNMNRRRLEGKCRNYSIPVNPLKNQKFFYEDFESAYYFELPKGKASDQKSNNLHTTKRFFKVSFLFESIINWLNVSLCELLICCLFFSSRNSMQ